jgi:CubicO group peptidase (beta-lactamase class C family)
MNRIVRSLASFIVVVTSPLVHPQAIDVAAIEKAIAQTMEQKQLVGLSVGVMHQGRVILAKGYGVTSLETRQPVTPETMFSAGSITKQFTCALALQLADRGELSMANPVSKYFPGASRGREITLMDLGNHVSGYRDYYPLDFAAGEMVKPRATALIIDDHVKGVDFTPGTQWSYSNTGFLMLGEIVGRLEGMPFERVLERRVFGPLGMKHTAYEVAPDHVGAATGYRSFMLGASSRVVAEGNGWLGAAGGIWSTPTDLLTWSLALTEGKLLSVSSQQALTTPRRLANGRSTAYACGLGIGDRDGMLAWVHTGGTSGFSARSVILPGLKSSVVLMTNVENVQPALFDLYASIVGTLLPPRPEPPKITGSLALSVAASLMEQMQAGTPDRARFAEAFNTFLTPERVQAAAVSLGRLGEPKSIEVTSADERGGLEHTVILFKFDSANAEADMYRSPDGLVHQFLVSKK